MHIQFFLLLCGNHWAVDPGTNARYNFIEPVLVSLAWIRLNRGLATKDDGKPNALNKFGELCLP